MQDGDLQVEKWLSYVENVVRQPSPPPFAEQWRRFEEISAERPAPQGPLPAWIPSPDSVAASNIGRLSAERGIASYEDLHHWSVTRKADFWSAVIDRLQIPFADPPAAVLGSNDPRRPEWLAGSTLDITTACFGGNPDNPAVISGSEGSDQVRTTTLEDLESMVNRVAHGIARLGIPDGAGVALFMPMTIECAAAYLGIIRAGHPVISVADSFAADELGKRLRIACAAAVITTDFSFRGGKKIDLYAKVRTSRAPVTVVIPGAQDSSLRLRRGDLGWGDFLGSADAFPAEPRAPSAATNILFSSGTTGDPKAIPWSQTTPIKCVIDGHFHQDIRQGDVVAWPTNIGWMMGPWLIYASLVNRATIALFEGLPSGPDFTRFVQEAGVTVLGVVPSLVRAWRDCGACDSVDWRRIRVFSSTGEPSDRELSLWLMSQNGYRAPVVEYCGGTEIGGGYITGTVVQPCAPATFTTPALGLDFVALDDDGREIEEDQEGEIFLIPPSIGLSEELLNRDHDEAYFAGCPTGPNSEILRRHGDQLRRLPGGFWRAQGRADDTMNLGGIKVSSKELERVVEGHPAVSEAAAVAVQPAGEGAEKLVLFIEFAGDGEPEDLRSELQREISDRLNPLFRIYDIVPLIGLPRTASGKLMRRVLRGKYIPSRRG